MNKNNWKNTSVVLALLIVISLAGGFANYYLRKPQIFLGSLNRHKFITNPLTPRVVLAEESFKWFSADSVFFIDTRPEDDREVGSIPGSFIWDDSRMQEMRGMIYYNRKKHIVFYCSVGCDHAERAAEVMSRMMPIQFYILFNGFEMWHDAGFQIEETGER